MSSQEWSGSNSSSNEKNSTIEHHLPGCVRQMQLYKQRIQLSMESHKAAETHTNTNESIDGIAGRSSKMHRPNPDTSMSTDFTASSATQKQQLHDDEEKFPPPLPPYVAASSASTLPAIPPATSSSLVASSVNVPFARDTFNT